MAKTKSQFVCQNCGASYPKWQGQCTDCGQWNTLVEETVKSEKASFGSSVQFNEGEINEKLISFSQVKLVSGSEKRFLTGIGELDRCLGGGLVGGMVVLLAGEPGIGKSTLLTQMILRILTYQQLRRVGLLKFPKDKLSEKQILEKSSSAATKNNSAKLKGKVEPVKDYSQKRSKIFFVAGEESPSQIMLRINRLMDSEQFLANISPLASKKLGKEDFQQISDEIRESVSFITSTDADQIAYLVKREKPSLLIVDSIQTLSTTALTGMSGSVGQIRESADRVIEVAKTFNIPCFLVGHITKDGEIAGPKVLEHMVDSVLMLEGERSGQLRILRSLKNRFGATDEVGIFQNQDYGLEEVKNPSALFLENSDASVVGAATVCLMEGSRPLLAEVQALLVKSQLAMPRRVGRGIDLARIQVLSAVLQKHARIPLAFYDVFLSVAGGFRIKEASVDLGLAVAMASSISNIKIAQNIVFIGEIGLLGEIRKTPYFERRAKEARRLGFSKIISADSHKNISHLLREMGLTKSYKKED